MPSPPNRVLIYRLGSLGDTLIALPALHLVARAFPSAERRMLTNIPVSSKAPSAAAILESTGLVHGYLSYSVGTRSPRRLLDLWWQIRRFRPQRLIFLGPNRGTKAARRDALFFRLCGIPAARQIGVPLTDDMQTPRRESNPDLHVLDSLTNTYEPEASRLARNLAILGDARLDDPASWDLHLTPAEHARAAQVLATAQAHPIIAVSVGTKVQAKDWGSDNWRTLLARLATLYPGHALALCGAAEEAEASAYAAQRWREARASKPKSGSSPASEIPVLNLCGLLTPRESAAVFARSALFLGHDSGPMHLAAAAQTPTVCIFAARNLPRVWFPYGPRNRVLYHPVDCAGCGLEICIVQKKKCILSITVDEVLAQIQQVLAPAQASAELHTAPRPPGMR